MIAMHMVACSPDYLYCRDLPTEGVHWDDVEQCRQGMPQWIASARKRLPEKLVVMARCRFLIARDGRSLKAF